MRNRSRHALLVGYGGGHIAMLIPVARALEERGWRVSLIALTTASAMARAAGFAPLGFADFFSFAAAEAARFGEELCPDVPENGPVSRRETIAYHGANFAELVARYGLNEARRRYRRDGRQAFLPVEFMAKIIGNLAPDIVITTNSPRAERATVIAAGQLGVPSVCLVDMFALHEIQWVGENGFADRVCVLNDVVRDMFVAHGRNPGDLVVSGNPAFDPINSSDTRVAGAALRELRGWDDGRCTILWASNQEPARHPFTNEPGDPQMPRRVEACLQSFVAADERFRLIIRRHPSETIPVVTGDRIERSLDSDPLHPLLHAVDLVCVQSSTVALEAWLARKPVITVDCSIFTSDAPFSKMGISRGVSGVDELALDLAGMDGNKPAFPLAGQVQPPATDRSATQTIVTVIEDLLANPAE